ncbi:MAG: orotate phosphoribosyltransferase [Planctomycetota bacterium]
MSQDKRIEEILIEDGALLEGHFRLRSGKHSARYLQCAKVYEHPAHAEIIARGQAGLLGGAQVDAVIGPATGAIIAAYELARVLGCRALFAEREDGVFTLRRGFAVEPGEKVVIVEDVITTGGAAKEVVELAGRLGADVVAVVVIVNRSGGNPFDVPLHYLYEFEAPAWEPEECPLCREGVPVVKPGSSPGGKK